MNDWLQWPVNSNVKRLTKCGTFTRDVFNFQIKLLIKPSTNDIMWNRYKSKTKSGIMFPDADAEMNVLCFFQALCPHSFMHFPTILYTASWTSLKIFCINPIILLIFENWHRRQLHAIHIHCHCNSGPSFVLCGGTDVDCLNASHIQSLFGVKGEENRGIIYIDNDFFTICFTYILHEIECIWCCHCRRMLRFMSTW